METTSSHTPPAHLMPHARQEVSLLLASVRATRDHADAVDLRSIPAHDRESVKEARLELRKMEQSLARIIHRG